MKRYCYSVITNIFTTLLIVTQSIAQPQSSTEAIQQRNSPLLQSEKSIPSLNSYSQTSSVDASEDARKLNEIIKKCDVSIIAQSISTYHASKFGAISTMEEADKIFRAIKGRVHGVEYETLFYSDDDVKVHRKLAESAHTYGIELWATSMNLMSRARAFVNVSSDYQAYRMLADGAIIPATIEGRPLFDVLNQAAMDIFIKKYKEKYLAPMRGALSGYFFNEDVLISYGKRDRGNNYRYEYWNNPTYSLAVLSAWRDYCKAKNVRHNGNVVERFPVHEQQMVAKGGGLTEFFPGYNVPRVIFPGQSFSKLPRSDGVWAHWDNFISERFQAVWIDQIAATTNEVNQGNPAWKGVLYFGLHHWTLPYEIVSDERFVVTHKHKWGAWGRQRGIDLESLSASPHISGLVCETFPPISENLENYLVEFKRLAEKNGKKFGVMLHRDDTWKVEEAEEWRRWDLIFAYTPTYIVRYPLENMLPWGGNYSSKIEGLFDAKADEYIKNRCPTFNK